MRWELSIGEDIKNLSESFKFTPQFGEFVEYQNLFDYINQVCRKEKMNMKIVDLQVSWQKDFVFKINPLNLKLGHLWLLNEGRTKNYKWDKNEWVEVKI